MRVLLLLLPVILCAGTPRFARVSEISGTVEVQVHIYDPWLPALSNTPLLESSRIRAAQGSQAVIELEEGTTLTLAGDSLLELSDYTRLSSGQRITLISLDHGIVYLSASPGPTDSFHVTVPGSEIMLRKPARIRFDVSPQAGQIAIFEGHARFSTPTAELELNRGQMVEVTPGVSSRFKLLREIPEMETDRAVERREQAVQGSHSIRYLPGVRYGAVDLDLSGTWHETEEAGLVWKPKAGPEYTPFRTGRWRWYDEIGYVWLSAESWGWAPYHYGRWFQSPSLGWVWSPGNSSTFKPGEVYWMRGETSVLWGPLAPMEYWPGSGAPQQYAALNSTLARFLPGQRELAADPEAVKSKELLATTTFALALPSPPLDPGRLDTTREPLRSSPPRALSLAPEVQISGASFVERPLAQPPTVVNPPAVPRAIERKVYVEVPVLEEVFYPYPVYTGFIVLNPPVPKVPVKKNKDLFKPSLP